MSKEDHSCSYGPVSTLPGHITRLDGDSPVVPCDKDDNPASTRIQGETDSFGAEYINLCEGCYRDYLERQKTADNSGVCDTCKKHADRVRAWRDPDEGSSGPVYYICDPCRKRFNEAYEE